MVRDKFISKQAKSDFLHSFLYSWLLAYTDLHLGIGEERYHQIRHAVG